MRPLSFSVMLLTSLLFFSACNTVPEQSGGPEPADAPTAVESQTPVPEEESGRIPYELQAASITPSLQNQILEKKKENSDAIGWLIVPGTTINDVVLQNPPGDNNYYTTHDFSRQPNRNGAYGIDYNNSFCGVTRETLFRNTPLYAHNHDGNPDGILFAQLQKFKDPDFAKAHPYVFFSTGEEDMVWEIFAVFDATTEIPYIEPGIHWSAFNHLLETIYDASIYDYGITVSESDKLLTLSTCTFSVPGHEAMPVTAENEYRFVIMARLLDQGEPIKTEAAFTINDTPLSPDDFEIPPYLKDDILALNGLKYDNFNTWRWFYNNGCVEPIDFGRFVETGRIQRSHMNDPLKDWEATQLAEGTAIYQNPDYPGVLMAEVEGRKIVYISESDEREIRSVRYIHQNRDGIVTDKSLPAGEFFTDGRREKLSRFIDMMRFTPLPDDAETIIRGEAMDEIRLGQKDSLCTSYQIFFTGTPPSIGNEVMIIKQLDGYYYGGAALYGQLEDTLNGIFTPSD